LNQRDARRVPFEVTLASLFDVSKYIFLKSSLMAICQSCEPRTRTNFGLLEWAGESYGRGPISTQELRGHAKERENS